MVLIKKFSGALQSESIYTNDIEAQKISSQVLYGNELYTREIDGNNLNIKYDIKSKNVDTETLISETLISKSVNVSDIVKTKNLDVSGSVNVDNGNIKAKSISTGNLIVENIESKSISTGNLIVENIDANNVISETIGTNIVNTDIVNTDIVNTQTINVSETIEAKNIKGDFIYGKSLRGINLCISNVINTNNIDVSDSVNVEKCIKSKNINADSIDANEIITRTVYGDNLKSKCGIYGKTLEIDDSIIGKCIHGEKLNVDDIKCSNMEVGGIIVASNDSVIIKSPMNIRNTLAVNSITSGDIASKGSITTDKSFISRGGDSKESLLIENSQGIDVFRVDTKDEVVYLNKHLNIGYNRGNGGRQITLENSDGNINCSLGINDYGNLELINSSSINILARDKIRLDAKKTVIGNLTTETIDSENDSLIINKNIFIDKSGTINSKNINVNGVISYINTGYKIFSNENENGFCISNKDSVIATFNENGIQTKRIYGLHGIPVERDEAVNKKYVDSLLMGLRPKEAVRVATIKEGNLDTDFENGSIVDDIILETGDRILLKNQKNHIENGIWIIKDSGAPERAYDLDVHFVEIKSIENLWEKKLIKVNVETDHNLEKGDYIYIDNHIQRVYEVYDDFSFNFESKYTVEDVIDKNVYIGSHAHGVHVVVQEGLENEMMTYVCSNELRYGDIVGCSELNFVLFSKAN